MMDLKLTFLVLIPLFATAASQQSTRFTPSGALNNQGYVPNSALRPWGTVPPPITNHGNPTSTTLSPFRPFGTVPPPRGHQPQNRPWHLSGQVDPRYPHNYGHRYSPRRLEPDSDNSGSPVIRDPGVTLPPLLLRSGIGSEVGVTLPPLPATRSSAGSEPGVTLPPPPATRSSAGSQPGVTLPPLSSISSAGNDPGVTTMPPTFATERTNSNNGGGGGRNSTYVRFG